MELSAFAKTNTAARLRAAASRGALSHALILSGAGDRNAAAHYAAAALECTGTDKPCLACAHCRKVLADIHPDVLTVRDDEHAELSVDVIRGVRTDAFIRPNEGACKVYIFPDCTRLNEKDQNVLLKTVEEGPPYAAFLFCAENASVLLPTIRSRCVEVKLPPAGTVGEDDERTRELLRLIAEGAPPAEPRDEQALRAVLGSRLTKAQILGTIELLETYRNHCEYNVGVGPLLGGLAVELEEIL